MNKYGQRIGDRALRVARCKFLIPLEQNKFNLEPKTAICLTLLQITKDR